MNWFYWNDGEKIGPISAAELKRLAQTGVVSPSTTVEDETGKSALAERVSGLFASPSSAVLGAKVERLTETLAAFETRFGELTERLDRVENRVADVENKEPESSAAFETRLGELAERLERVENRVADVENKEPEESATLATLETRLERWDAALTAVVGKLDALTERAAALERRLDEERAGTNAVAPTRSTGTSGVLNNAGNDGEFEAPAGTIYGGIDFPAGRYRIEAKRGETAIVDLRDKKEGKGSWYLGGKNSAVVIEVSDGWRLRSTGPTVWKFLSALVDQSEPEKKKRKATSLETSSDYRLPSGTHRVGTDIPPGRYRAEIRRGRALVEVETRDDYEGYNLDTDVDSDDYNPSCVIDLRSGAKLTLDKPTDFTYLGALR